MSVRDRLRARLVVTIEFLDTVAVPPQPLST